ncbi:MAG: phosphoribosylaminoimidazolesuccinocarboxamide synthase [Bdellovibrionales bacterium]|nr:phosphoribosylaminoimidazolesuccinocarboxamide synthase [Bdellovibrionales bacterium]
MYEGKGKKIFSVKDRDDLVWMQFKDDLTAFNAEKKGSFEGKGKLNCQIATLIFNYLNRFQIPNHFVETISDVDMVSKKVEIIPLEVIVRNWLAGSTAKKFQREEGERLETPLQEFFYKDDGLGDPFINDEQALYLKAASSMEELQQLKLMAREINGYLFKLFDEAGLKLIDFKLEFGRDSSGKILLADEITPDSCRLWDKETDEKFDKDRFRRDLGDVDKGYAGVFDRLKKVTGE